MNWLLNLITGNNTSNKPPIDIKADESIKTDNLEHQKKLEDLLKLDPALLKRLIKQVMPEKEEKSSEKPKTKQKEKQTPWDEWWNENKESDKLKKSYDKYLIDIKRHTEYKPITFEDFAKDEYNKMVTGATTVRFGEDPEKKLEELKKAREIESVLKVIAFFEADSLVKAKTDIKDAENTIIIKNGTTGIVLSRDLDIPERYWVLFKGAVDATTVTENEIELIQKEETKEAALNKYGLFEDWWNENQDSDVLLKEYSYHKKEKEEKKLQPLTFKAWAKDFYNRVYFEERTSNLNIQAHMTQEQSNRWSKLDQDAKAFFVGMISADVDTEKIEHALKETERLYSKQQSKTAEKELSELTLSDEPIEHTLRNVETLSKIERKNRINKLLDEYNTTESPARKQIIERQLKELRANLNVISKIVKHKDGWHVVSEEGKNLGGPYSSKKKAVKRLKQVEWHKNKKSALNAIIENAVRTAKTEEDAKNIIKQAEQLIDFILIKSAVSTDLSKIKDAFAYELGQEFSKLTGQEPLNALKQIVISALNRSNVSEDYKRKVLLNLNRMFSAQQLYSYMANVVLRGAGMSEQDIISPDVKVRRTSAENQKLLTYQPSEKIEKSDYEPELYPLDKEIQDVLRLIKELQSFYKENPVDAPTQLAELSSLADDLENFVKPIPSKIIPIDEAVKSLDSALDILDILGLTEPAD